MIELKRKYRINRFCRFFLYFYGSWLAVCCMVAAYRLHLHMKHKNVIDYRKYVSKCGCLQLALENLGFDKLVEKLDGQQHYEQYKIPRPLNSIVPDYCVELIDDLDLNTTSEMKRMDKRCFREVMPPETRKAFAKDAYDLVTHLQSIGVFVAMSQGTALGSLRAHGFLPWDDDLDFMVLWDDRETIEKKLVEVGKQKGIKFFIDKSDGIGRYRIKCGEDKKWCGMTIDLWYSTFYNDGWFFFPPLQMDIILPLTTRPFEGYWFPSVANLDEYLTISYGADYFTKCVFHNHMYEAQKPDEEECPELPCAKLKWRREYPHVEWCALDNGYTFEMYINERHVHSVFLRKSVNVYKD